MSRSVLGSTLKEDLVFYRITTVLSLLLSLVLLISLLNKPTEVLYQPHAKGPQLITLGEIKDEDVLVQVQKLDEIVLDLDPDLTNETLSHLKEITVGKSSKKIIEMIDMRLQSLKKSQIAEYHSVVERKYKKSPHKTLNYEFATIVDVEKKLKESGDVISVARYVIEYDLTFMRKNSNGWYFALEGLRRYPYEKYNQIKDQI